MRGRRGEQNLVRQVGSAQSPFRGFAKAPAMAGPVHTMSQAVRNVWSAVTGQTHSARAPAAPVVILYDPAAQRPHDLDDPFFDDKVQARMADVIACAGHKK